MSHSQPQGYKQVYADSWDEGNYREELINDMVKLLGFSPDYDGFGAGETRYIEGSGEDNGKDPSQPDIYVPEIDTEIEVTGTNKSSVTPHDDLWVQTNKVEHADKNSTVSENWFVHVLGQLGIARAIPAYDGVYDEKIDDEITVYPRGKEEQMIPFDANSSYVIPVTAFIQAIRPRDFSKDECDRVVSEAKAKWTTRDSLLDETRQYIVLRVESESPVRMTRDGVPMYRCTTTAGEDVIVKSNPENPVFEANAMQSGEWYEFIAVEGRPSAPTPGVVVTRDTELTAFDATSISL